MYEFGHFRLKEAERLLERDGEALVMQPKTFDLLVYFVRNAGRLIHKEELLEKVWTDSHVEEANLAVHVSALRKLFGGAANEYIVTVPKFGYRFAADVRKVEAPTEALLAIPEERASSRNWGWRMLVAGLVLVIFAGLILMKQKQPAWNPIPLTASAEEEMSPALSPDGKRVVYSLRGNWHGTPDPQSSGLRMKTLGSDEAVVLTQQADFNAAWSPDGKEIAFIRFVPLPGMMDETLLMVRSMENGQEKMVVKVNYRTSLPGPGVSYSLDGKWLLTSVGTGFFDGSSPRRLAAVSRATGETKVFFDPPRGSLGDSNPVLSPKGDRMAFCRCRTFHSCDLFEVKLSGLQVVGAVRAVTDFGMPELRAVYLADGSLVFPYGPLSGRVLWRSGTDWLGRTFSEQLASGGDDVSQLTIARRADGQESLAYVRNHVDSNIYALDLESGKVAKGGKPLIASNRLDQTPAFSPDGEQIAFASTRSGMWEIWTCNAEGEKCRQVTHMGPAFSRNPAWSKDGRWLAFESRAKGESQLFLVDLRTGIQKQITQGEMSYSDPTWSPDGKYLYFTSNRSGKLEIYRAAVVGGGEFSSQYEQITLFGGSHAQIAPDGTTMLFTGTDWLSNRMTIGSAASTLPADGRGERAYFIYPPVPGSGSWAYGLLYFEENAFWGKRNWETNEVRRFVAGKYDRNVSVALSPNEKRLLWAQTDASESDLAMVERLRY